MSQYKQAVIDVSGEVDSISLAAAAKRQVQGYSYYSKWPTFRLGDLIIDNK